MNQNKETYLMVKGDVRRFLSTLIGRYQGLQTRLCTKIKDLELVDELGSPGLEDQEKGVTIKYVNLEKRDSGIRSVQEDLTRLQGVLKDIQRIYTAYLELNQVECRTGEE